MQTAGERAQERPRADSEDRLSALFRDHSRRVFDTALRVTGRVADAEDVLQTVFARLTKREWEVEPDWGPYLRRAAVNAGFDVLRSRQRHDASDLETVAGRLAAAGPGTDASARLAELEVRVREALTRETPRAAEIFALRCFEDYGYQEIADLVGTSRSVVAVTLFRVRGRLKRELGDPS